MLTDNTELLINVLTNIPNSAEKRMGMWECVFVEFSEADRGDVHLDMTNEIWKFRVNTKAI